MSENPEIADDPLVNVDRKRLRRLVESGGVFTMAEFGRFCGWDFDNFWTNVPQSKKDLAWKILSMPKHQQRSLKEVRDRFPTLWCSGVKDDPDPGAGHGHVVPLRRAGVI